MARYRARPHGIRHRWQNPLSDYQVYAIRQLVIDQAETMADVARLFHCSYGYVNDLVHCRKRVND